MQAQGRMGPGKDDLKEIRILNRIVTWTEEGVEHEGDQRHVEIACKEYGLKTGSKAALLPGSKEKPSDKEEVQLPPFEVRSYRGGVARANYLGQGGSDIPFSIKELSKAMAAPTVGDVK